VATAQAALDVLLSWRPRVVLCDLAMPDVDGIDFLRMLRARPAELGGDLPVIGMTAYVGLERREQARIAGFERLLLKPVRAEALLQTIGQAITSEKSLS
jgi:CheY-like chemotaxis protein